jgi:hypothetical protein
VVVSGYEDIEISSGDMLGCSYVKLFMFQGVPGSVYLGIRVSRCQDVRLLGSTGVRISGNVKLSVSECPSFGVSRC